VGDLSGGTVDGGVELALVRRAVLMLPLLAASTLVLAPTADGAEPASGTVSHQTPTVTWSGSAPVQTFGVQGAVDCAPATSAACDTYALTVEELAGTTKRHGRPRPLPDDVVVSIATPDVPPGTVAEFDLYVYGPDGALVGRGTEFGGDTVVLDDAVAGTYTVAVTSALSTDPTAMYEGRATVAEVEAGASADDETACGFEGDDTLRSTDGPIGAGALVGDPDAALDGQDGGAPLQLRVQAVLDGIMPEEADAIFAGAARSYAPLGIELVVVKPYLIHAFGTNDASLIITRTKELVGGVRPPGVDIVEALVATDIQQLNLNAIAGLADCIGGVAHDDRAFLVAEGRTPSNYGFEPVPVYFGYDANAHVTAHEIGHLMGGQHHYANCVEGIQESDVHEDHVEGSPCTLMFNSADFLGENFDTLNGWIVRGSAERYAGRS
jgi:hypothetical protein